MFKTEVLVIGGGPAGSAAAIALAQQGIQVTLIEGKPFPRHRPGETLHPGIEPLLQQLGVADGVLSAGFPRHEGHWVEWGSPRQFVPFGEDEGGAWQGFQAWRSQFDALLLHRAQALGVEICQPCRALKPIVVDGRISGLATSEGSWQASFVIDAAGSRQWLAKQLGLRVQTHSPRLIARYGYAEGDCPQRDRAPAIVADRQGWTWTARVRPQLYQWTRLSWGGDRLHRDWLPAEFRGLQPQGNPRAADVTWRMVPQMAGAGYFLVGDAATVLDPASSHGVLKAVMSGMMAARAIVRIARQGRESWARGAYCRWMGDWFEQDLGKLKELYAQLFPVAS